MTAQAQHWVRPADVQPDSRGVKGLARVAVLVSLNFPDMTSETADLMRRFTSTALKTLHEMDLDFELLDTSRALLDPTVTSRFDGLLVLGGGDIAPDLAGCASRPGYSYGIDRQADIDSIQAIHAAIEAGRPILGICRGAQLINVAYGGTIIGDIDDYTLHRGGPGRPIFLDELVDITKGSKLHQMLAQPQVTVRSGHHQAVDRVGDDLRVAARALDGITEAIEHPSRWVLGVQWHPEDPDASGADRRRLFAGFANACAGLSRLVAW